jgi:ATP-dependent protease HslVU (ClpYQ) peptidase subunit
MTCIAYKDGIISGDSLYTHTSLISSRATKIKKLRIGSLLPKEDVALYGATGDNDDRELEKLLQECLLSETSIDIYSFPLKRDLVHLNSDLAALIIIPQKFTTEKKENEIYVISTKYSENDEAGVTKVTHPYWAIGSGAELAIGAMAAGASSEKAIEIACQFDIHCDLPIHSYCL